MINSDFCSLDPPYGELYVANANGLQNVSLCPFLQDMNEKEKRIQEAAIRAFESQTALVDLKACVLGATLGYQWGLIGSMIGCCIGAVASLQCTGSHYFVQEPEPLNFRIQRVAQRIQEIKSKQSDLDVAANAQQLEFALTHFTQVKKAYFSLKSAGY